MRMHDGFTDEAGQAWEFKYDAALIELRDPFGNVVAGEEGRPELTSEVRDFRYRRVGEDEWRELPPWADVREDWKITLGFFDEDEDGDIERYWPIVAEEPCPACGGTGKVGDDPLGQRVSSGFHEFVCLACGGTGKREEAPA